MLKISKLEVVYHHISTAIQVVSLEVQEGNLVAIIGANGAGKTTTLRAISGFLGIDNARITDGEINFQGEKLNGLPPHQIARRGIVLVPERNKVFETLSLHENLAILSASNSRGKDSTDRIYEYFPILKARKGSLAGFLSGGERQMLAMGQALLCSPKLLLIDEMSQGLAPLVISHLVESLLQMKGDLGLTVLMVEQNAATALDVADYAAVMENGRIVFDGPREKLLHHEDVREFYLGLKGNAERTYRDVKQYRRSRRWWG
jgi:branched-chain amino acid transport system ATP-binding protein